jgi:hypothetical protein
MAKDKHRLFETVRLLSDVIDQLQSRKPKGDQGPSGVLWVRLKRLRRLLSKELKQPQPGWREVIVPSMLREAAKWLGEFVTNNLRWQARPDVFRALRTHIGSGTGHQILPA